MKELSIGHPALLSTDVGPVIDEIAAGRLQDHIDDMTKTAKLIGKLNVPGSCKKGTYIAPHVFEISSIDVLKEEHFGPILHIVRYKAKDLPKVIDAINATQFGLTLGVQSLGGVPDAAVYQAKDLGAAWKTPRVSGVAYSGPRDNARALNREIAARDGGILQFVWRDAIDPHLALRFVTERTLTINTAAIGGNADLLGIGGGH